MHDTLQRDDFRKARGVLLSIENKAYQLLDDTEKASARAILSNYGMLARMVEHHAIDEVLFRGYWRSALLRDWERMAIFVAGESNRSKNNELFVSTEKLVKSWKRGGEINE